MTERAAQMTQHAQSALDYWKWYEGVSCVRACWIILLENIKTVNLSNLKDLAFFWIWMPLYICEGFIRRVKKKSKPITGLGELTNESGKTFQLRPAFLQPLGRLTGGIASGSERESATEIGFERTA